MAFDFMIYSVRGYERDAPWVRLGAMLRGGGLLSFEHLPFPGAESMCQRLIDVAVRANADGTVDQVWDLLADRAGVYTDWSDPDTVEADDRASAVSQVLFKLKG